MPKTFVRAHAAALGIAMALVLLSPLLVAQVSAQQPQESTFTQTAVNSLVSLTALVIGLLGFVHNRLQARETKLANHKADEAKAHAEQRKADSDRIQTFLDDTLARLRDSEQRNDLLGKQVVEFRVSFIEQLKKLQGENAALREENSVILAQWKEERHDLKGLLQQRELETEQAKTMYERETGEMGSEHS